MIRLVESNQSWGEKYGLPTDQETSCPKCGKLVKIDTPYATKDERGFISQDHGCGMGYRFKVCISKNKLGSKFWDILRGK